MAEDIRTNYKVYIDQFFNSIITEFLKVGKIIFPMTDGLPGQVITTNGKGQLYFTSSGTGDVVGPGSSTDNAIARYDGTTGKLVQNSSAILSDAGSLSINGLSLGSLVFPTIDGSSGQVLTTNGSGNLSFQSPSSFTINILLGFLNTAIKINIGVGDHIKFQTILGSIGTNISLDISTPYTTTLGVNSIGRITLQPGMYSIQGTFQGLTFALSLGSITYQWYNADTGTAIVSVGGTILGTLGLSGINGPTSLAVVTPLVTTRYELRITSVVSLSAISQVILDVVQMN